MTFYHNRRLTSMLYFSNLTFQNSLIEGCKLPVKMPGTEDWRKYFIV